jgi:hypothetical protein
MVKRQPMKGGNDKSTRFSSEINQNSKENAASFIFLLGIQVFRLKIALLVLILAGGTIDALRTLGPHHHF